MVNQEQTELLWNRQVASGYWRMGVSTDDGYADAQPGQFVMVHVETGLYPLLRRPFSIHRLIEKNGVVSGIEVLYRVVGLGTEILSNLRAGDRVGLLGPLGLGFRVLPGTRRIYLAAGGIGVAPMPFLLDRLKSSLDMDASRVFLGGRTQNDLLCRDLFDEMGIAVIVTTDDGSAGDQCFLTHPLEAAVRQDPPGLIVACGPMGMLSCVAGIARRCGVPCQVSLESAMACGIGACLGCAVKPAGGKQHYLHACKEGPVFDIDEIDLEHFARP
ncbi:MAG: dihydroorotate dehydrogenase electron transfer subunit [Desulfobacterales bacterium]